MNSNRRCLVSLAILSSTSVPNVYAAPSDNANRSAETTTQDRALAEALFRDGKALVQAERIEEACVKFQESQRLDPALGTLLHLATCYAQTGKTASAWAAFHSAVEIAHRNKDTARESLALGREKELEARLSRLTITITSPERGMTIRVDERLLGPGAMSTPLPFDPGLHVIKATAPGKQTWSTTFELEPGPVQRDIQIPTLRDAVVKATTTESELAPEPLPPSRPDETTASFNWRLAGLVTLGVGVVGVGAGSYFGIRAYSQAKDADRNCTGLTCTQQGLDGHATARQSAVYSNIGFGVGIVGLVAGTCLIAFNGSNPKSVQSALWIRAGAGQVVAGGTF